MNLKRFLFCLCLKAQWWGLWFTQAGSCAVSWTPPIPSIRYSNVRQSPPRTTKTNIWSFIYHAFECIPVIDCVFSRAVPLHTVAVLNQTITLLDRNVCIRYNLGYLYYPGILPWSKIWLPPPLLQGKLSRSLQQLGIDTRKLYFVLEKLLLLFTDKP